MKNKNFVLLIDDTYGFKSHKLKSKSRIYKYTSSTLRKERVGLKVVIVDFTDNKK